MEVAGRSVKRMVVDTPVWVLSSVEESPIEVGSNTNM
jgi:hypothetical protein